MTDENGKIIAHSDPQQVGKTLYSPAQMRALAVGEQAAGAGLANRSRRWRSIAIFARLIRPAATIWE